jgi:hypothetical protein
MFELDIPSISAIAAAVGVLVGVVLTVVELRNLTKTRQMDLIMKVNSTWLSKEMLQSWDTLRKTEFKNYSDYEEKCSVESRQIVGFFDSLGLLLKRRLVDIGLISDLFILEAPWKKMKPFVEGLRERANDRRLHGHFEYLYHEWKRRERQLQQKGAKNG